MTGSMCLGVFWASWPFWIAVFTVLGVLSALRAVLTARTPQGAVAWASTLIGLPFFAVPAYWVFGQGRYGGTVRYRRGADAKLDSLVDRLREDLREYAHTRTQGNAETRVLERIVRLPFLVGNSVELLIDGPDIFDSMIEAIDQAKTQVITEFYMVNDDGIGGRFKDALVRAAGRGCRVYLLYDDIGSGNLTAAYCRELCDAGVHVSSMNTKRGLGKFFQLNFRNHRKIVVVDCAVAYIGGANIGDEYAHRDKRLTPWRDTYVRIKGPTALVAQFTFTEDWHWATESVPDLAWEVSADETDDTPILVLPSGPDDDYETCGMYFSHCINSATKRVWIATPYFVPDEGVHRALELAALRGVDVRILLPGLSDSRLVRCASRAYMPGVLKSGGRIMEFQDGFMHQKVMLVDDDFSIVGTANFDNRSFRLNFEVTAATLSTEFASQVEQMLQHDFDRSTEISADDRRFSAIGCRVVTGIARLFAPVL